MENLNYSGLTLQHFQFFIKVTELGTMVKAAKELNVSQPLLSQKIAQLEESLGVKLFSRYKRMLVLTEAGEQFLKECSEVMNSIDEMFYSIRENYAETPEKPLKIGFSDGQEASQLAQVFGQLRQAFPEQRVDIIIENRMRLMEMLLNDELDICSIVDTEQFSLNKNINYRKLQVLSLNCVVNRAASIAVANTLDWHDLDGLICHWPSSLCNSALTRDIKMMAKANGAELKFDIHNVDYFTIRNYIKAEEGITLTLSPQIEDPSLKMYRLSGLSYPFIIAWQKKDMKRLEKYVEKMTSLVKNLLKSYNS